MAGRGLALATEQLARYLQKAQWSSVEKFIGRVIVLMLGALVMSGLIFCIKEVRAEILAL